MSFEYTVILADELCLRCRFDYYPGTPATMYLPMTQSYVEIDAIWIEGSAETKEMETDIVASATDTLFEMLSQAIYENFDEWYDGADE